MAITRLNKIRRRYNKQIDRLKNQYKKETGKKNARGIEDNEKFADELRRIRRNENQALYRYQKEKQLERSSRLTRFNNLEERYDSQIDSIPFKEGTNAYKKEFRRIQRNRKASIRRYKKSRTKASKNLYNISVLLSNAPYHTALDYGGISAPRAVRDAFQQAKKNRKGKAARLIIEDTTENTVDLYTDEFQADFALRRLYSDLMQKQDGSLDFLVDLVTGESDFEFLVTVTVKENENIVLSTSK